MRDSRAHVEAPGGRHPDFPQVVMDLGEVGELQDVRDRKVGGPALPGVLVGEEPEVVLHQLVLGRRLLDVQVQALYWVRVEVAAPLPRQFGRVGAMPDRC